MRSRRTGISLLTCEHASHALPAPYRARFARHERRLRSHRGWDRGALVVARALSRALGVPLIAGNVSRLLVDLNRSPHNPAVLGALGRTLTRAERGALLERWHRPYWARVRATLDGAAGRPVVHVAVHSFVPVLGGRRRRFDVGLLYDPARGGERRVAEAWKRSLEEGYGLRVRRNAPYRGTSDGLTTRLRRERGARDYLGIELELNQALLADARRRRRVVEALVATLRAPGQTFDGSSTG